LNTFATLGLHPSLVQTVADLGYEQPTPIQSALIPIMIEGKDAIGQAQTGTGKTAAFTLPTLHRLSPGSGRPQALVLAPTRELAMQVARAMHEYGAALGVRVLPVYGGQPYRRQIDRLRKGVDVVVGTPGRLLDLLRQNALDLGGVQTVILDEADEMLSMGFIEDIEAILEATPAQRQTALLSATLPAGVRSLAQRYMRDPQACTVERQRGAETAIEHRAHVVNHSDKLPALTRLLEIEPVVSALVFAQTRVATAEMAFSLSRAGFSAEALSGEMSQPARAEVLRRFRDREITILVATDVAARGLDIDHVSHVFNLDLPTDPEVYVHRVGRTGRAGRSGVAISLISPKQRGLLRRVESVMRQPVPLSPVPGPEQVQAHRDAAALDALRARLAAGARDRDARIINTLWSEGFDPMEVAAAALSMARTDEDARPLAPIADLHGRRAPREKTSHGRPAGAREDRKQRGSHEAGMVRIAMDIGRQQGVQPGQIVSAIARHADIPGNTIGKISIRDQHTLVDVLEQHVDQVLSRTGSFRLGKHLASVERA
jgi:ATP-dependent RNA helicase DeaD